MIYLVKGLELYIKEHDFSTFKKYVFKVKKCCLFRIVVQQVYCVPSHWLFDLCLAVKLACDHYIDRIKYSHHKNDRLYETCINLEYQSECFAISLC